MVALRLNRKMRGIPKPAQAGRILVGQDWQDTVWALVAKSLKNNALYPRRFQPLVRSSGLFYNVLLPRRFQPLVSEAEGHKPLGQSSDLYDYQSQMSALANPSAPLQAWESLCFRI